MVSPSRFDRYTACTHAAAWVCFNSYVKRDVACSPGRTWTGGWLKQKQPTSIPSKYGLDGHCYVSGYISGHRLLEVRLSAARRPQGILLRSTHTQASLLQLVQLCLCCDYCCNSAYVVCGNTPCFKLA